MLGYSDSGAESIIKTVYIGKYTRRMCGRMQFAPTGSMSIPYNLCLKLQGLHYATSQPTTKIFSLTFLVSVQSTPAQILQLF
jgi:hypothetical protein